jgi:hypothetical protein
MRRFLTVPLAAVFAGFLGVAGAGRHSPGWLAIRQIDSGTPPAVRRSGAIPAQPQAHERQDPAGRGTHAADVQPRG